LKINFRLRNWIEELSKHAFASPSDYNITSVPNPLDSSGDLVRAFLGLICGTIVIAAAISAHIVNPILAIGMTIILIAAMARWMPETALIAVLVSMIFQNTFVSLASPHIDTTTSFNIIRGYNFVILCGTWGIFVLFIS